MQSLRQPAKKASPAVLLHPIHNLGFQSHCHLGGTAVGFPFLFRMDPWASDCTGFLLAFAPHPLVVHGTEATGNSLPITVFF